jgi:hypothetical protein
MSPERQRVVIAELCGFTCIAKSDFGPVNGFCQGELVRVPDYTGDLNAMHDALKVVRMQSKEADFWFQLRQVLGFPDAESDWSHLDFFSAVDCSAPQLAEALIRTFNKWEDSE